jgi:3-hydroxyisobutyrate dehydrogenase
MPVAEVTRKQVQHVIEAGDTERDFAVMLQYQADASGLQLESENMGVDDGLS